MKVGLGVKDGYTRFIRDDCKMLFTKSFSTLVNNRVEESLFLKCECVMIKDGHPSFHGVENEIRLDISKIGINFY
jgi:hypothetical protein